jgi:hypothetical protein
VVVQHDVVPLVQWGRGMTHRLSRSGDSSKVSSAVSMPACHVLMPLFCTAVTSSACRHTTTMRGRGMMVLQRVMPRLTHRCTCYTVTLHSCTCYTVTLHLLHCHTAQLPHAGSSLDVCCWLFLQGKS